MGRLADGPLAIEDRLRKIGSRWHFLVRTDGPPNWNLLDDHEEAVGDWLSEHCPGEPGGRGFPTKTAALRALELGRRRAPEPTL